MVERIRYGWEPLKAVLAEPNVTDLILAYNEELNPLPDVVRVDPDWPELLRRNEAGVFRVWAAHVEGTLAGFITFHIMPHLSFRSTLMALDAGHFLHPAFRGKGRIGFGMWRSVEPALRDLGVKVVLAHDNGARPLLPFFLALEYEPVSTVFWKAL